MRPISTSPNSAATVIHSDLTLRFLRPGPGERTSLRVLRSATLAFGIIGKSVSFLLLNGASALDAWWTHSRIFSGGILGLFLLGLRCRRAWSPAAAVVCGLLIISWITLTAAGLWHKALVFVEIPFRAFLAIVFGTITILVEGIVFSSFLAQKVRST